MRRGAGRRRGVKSWSCRESGDAVVDEGVGRRSKWFGTRGLEYKDLNWANDRLSSSSLLRVLGFEELESEGSEAMVEPRGVEKARGWTSGEEPS